LDSINSTQPRCKTVRQFDEHMERIYGRISFKGEVLTIHKIPRDGRTYGLMCIKIDYSNIDSFYIFDEQSCLKIKDNIVTMPTGAIGNRNSDLVSYILNSTYIEVNINQNRKIIFYNKKGESYSIELYYPNNNLRESDMTACD
jgi:hypothetical protein